MATNMTDKTRSELADELDYTAKRFRDMLGPYARGQVQVSIALADKLAAAATALRQPVNNHCICGEINGENPECSQCYPQPDLQEVVEKLRWNLGTLNETQARLIRNNLSTNEIYCAIKETEATLDRIGADDAAV